MISLKHLAMESFCRLSSNINDEVPSHIGLIDTAGYANTARLRDFCLPGDFGIWQIDFKHGWYIPAIGQLCQLATVIDMINPALKAHDGDTISMDLHYSLLSSSPGKRYSNRYDIYMATFDIMSHGVNKRSANIRVGRTFS